MTVEDFAEEIYTELGSPTNISEVFIEAWLRSNLGLLNTKIFSDFSLDGSNEITPELNEAERSIYKEMFSVFYYGFSIQANLGANAYESLLEATSDGTTIRRVNKNEIAKTFLSMMKESKDTLSKLIYAYNLGRSGGRAIHGDDTIEGSINDSCLC